MAGLELNSAQEWRYEYFQNVYLLHYFPIFLPIIVYDGNVYMCSKIYTKEYIWSIQSIQFSRIDDQKNMQKCKMHSPIFEKSWWDSLSKTESDLKKKHTQVIGHTSYFFSPCDATGT